VTEQEGEYPGAEDRLSLDRDQQQVAGQAQDQPGQQPLAVGTPGRTGLQCRPDEREAGDGLC